MQGDFDALFKALGLDELPEQQGTWDATFIPKHGKTIRSAPRDEITEPRVPVTTNSFTNTLPRLTLATPEAAQLNPNQPELEPLQIIGEGGMGRVLLARQSSLGREVAVKVIRSATGSDAAAEVMINEARTTGSLEHPSVVPIYALARDGLGQPALVMKRVEGLPWRDLMHDPKHPAWAKLAPNRDHLTFHVEVLVQVCNAVAHAHQRGVFHRDVKPANVLLGDLGEVYLADWGVALKAQEAAHESPKLVGTPAYLAPEMVSGDAKAIDARTDIYLLGATLHEVLTGAPPHVSTNLREVLLHAWESAPPQLFPDSPPLLAATCKKALAREPKDRFSNVIALRDALQLFLQHKGSTQLALVAMQRLVELETITWMPDNPAQGRRFYQLVSECRFGFKQALEASPDHREAKEGLRRCLEVAARHELTRGAAPSARAFLSELESPPKDLMLVLQKLEVAEDVRKDAEAQLKELRGELDVEVSRPQRTMVVLVLAAVVIANATVMILSGDRATIEANYGTWFRMVPLTLTAVIGTAIVFALRRALFSNRANRQFIGLLAVCMFGVLVHRGFSVLLGMSATEALGQDGVMLAIICAYGAVNLHPSFFLPASAFLLGALGCVLWPHLAVASFGFTSASALLLSSFALQIWRRKSGRRQR